uniref:uncharacterized protein LOC114674462 n=1 Tax=Macaca mulatta TaxID=9544 RepID=UPI0010A231DE|nr:uncharacterized protein LOC114674462 [Macaca mulatta]
MRAGPVPRGGEATAVRSRGDEPRGTGVGRDLPSASGARTAACRSRRLAGSRVDLEPRGRDVPSRAGGEGLEGGSGTGPELKSRGAEGQRRGGERDGRTEPADADTGGQERCGIRQQTPRGTRTWTPSLQGPRPPPSRGCRRQGTPCPPMGVQGACGGHSLWGDGRPGLQLVEGATCVLPWTRPEMSKDQEEEDGEAEASHCLGEEGQEDTEASQEKLKDQRRE